MNGADKNQLRQVRAAILGNRPDTALSNALYPVYVAVIAAGSYGVPAAQQLFHSLDEKWLADNAWTPAGALVASALVAMLMALVWAVGRVHGPVVPPLPYLEMVVASPMPRKVTLARHWRLSLGGSAVGGLLIGLVGGAGLSISGVTSASVLLPATVGGCLLGLFFAEFWLRGQVRGARGHVAGTGPSHQSSTESNGESSSRQLSGESLSGRRNSLALLDITSLRRQAASNVTMGGAVLAGDLRAVRLDAARPITRARRVRLRTSGPFLVIARRDLLGLRRAPLSAIYALGFAAAGSAGLNLSLQSPRTPTVAPLVSMVLCYLGFGAWCEGLRLHADNSGTSRLLGLPYRDTALAHLVVPFSAWVLTTTVVGVGLSLTGTSTSGTGLIWALGAGALLAATHLMAAFRGLPPAGLFGPHAGPPAMAFWYAKPVLGAIIVGTATAAWGARAGSPWTAFSWLLIGAALLGSWGLHLVDKRDRRS